MEKINGILTQEEFEKLSSELIILEAEEQFDGKDNKARIEEIEKIIEMKSS